MRMGRPAALPDFDIGVALEIAHIAPRHRRDLLVEQHFLDLIARSGTALFVSIDPEALTDAARLDLTDAMRLSETTHAERARRISPASWEYAVTPSDWTDSLGEQTTYRWDDGAELFA